MLIDKMKSISSILSKLRNLLPYFLLIAVYFFFVNLEARKGKYNILNADKENILKGNNSRIYDKKIRIKIPVIPYNQ